MSKATINLIDVDKSTYKYNIINFNDGETHIKFTDEINRKYPVHVVTRISSWDDLMLLMQVGDILNRMEVEFSIKITYLLSMRMDRVISFNEAYSLKIVANMINSLNATKVTIVEPHSDKTLKLINNAVSYDMIDTWRARITENTVVVFPDAGAKERYGSAIIDPNIPIVTCKKVRNPNTGELISFEIENPEVIDNLPDGPYYKFLVIDDLCDNGGTFMGIANLLNKWPMLKKEIAITHMVNPNGIRNLASVYDKVVFTNSYTDWNTEDYTGNINIIDVI